MLFYEKLAYGYFQNLFTKKRLLGDAFHRLNEHEQKQIAHIKTRAMWYAALFGTMGVVALYLPVHLNLVYFPAFDITLWWVGKVNVAWAYFLYMVFLALAEIYALAWLNLVTVHAICRVCRFPALQDENYDAQILILFEVSLDRNSKQQKELGINPLAGLSPARIFVVSTLFVLKATLSNLLMKFLLKRMFARFAIVGYAYYVDYMSILIFAGWNMYATHLVVNEAKTRVMAPNLIKQLVTRLHHQFKENEVFKNILLELLQFIAVAKRNYHHNHYLLASELFYAFSLPRLPEISADNEALLAQIKEMPQDLKQGVAKLFVLGLLIDGNLSRRELYITKLLEEQGIWKLKGTQLRQWEREYIEGKGLDKLFQEGVPL
jgi:hypothetical protein